MVVAICPECEYGLAALVEREARETEVLQHFECPKCDHEWSESML